MASVAAAGSRGKALAIWAAAWTSAMARVASTVVAWDAGRGAGVAEIERVRLSVIDVLLG